MNSMKKLISSLIVGATLVAAAPVFADSFHDRGYDYNRHGGHDRGYDYNRHGGHDRDYDRHGYRGYDRHVDDRRHFVVVERPYVVQRPYIVEQPVYYGQPAPSYGIGAMIGAAIGGIYDSRQ